MNDALNSAGKGAGRHLRSSLNTASGSNVPGQLFYDKFSCTYEKEAAPTVSTDDNYHKAANGEENTLIKERAVDIGISLSYVRKFRLCTNIYCDFITDFILEMQTEQSDDAQSRKEEAGAHLFLLSLLMNRKELAIAFWESVNVSGVLVQSFTILKISYIVYYRYLKILFRICISYIRILSYICYIES